jgi:TRAP-type mannitol/chloroaromatic compound transport system substrate-binding protein
MPSRTARSKWGHTVSYYFFGKDPTYALETAVPFGMTNRQMDAWMRHGNGTKLLGEFFAKSNIMTIPCGNTGADGRLVSQGNQDR